ncbi:type II secretion system protein [Nocardioides ultimimeridianus]
MQRRRGERRHRWRGNDRGETLVEVLAAVAVLGIAGVAVLAGLMLAIKASDIHRKQTSGSAYVRSFAEAIQSYVASGNYKPCGSAGTNAYKVSAVTDVLNLPSGYTATQGAAKSLNQAGGTGACAVAADDTGLEQLTLHVASTDGKANESVVIVLRKPCASGQGAC